MRGRSLEQGDLDGLCGVYAVMNAVASLANGLGKDQQKELFKQLIRAVYDRRKDLKKGGGVSFVHEGVGPAEIGAMLNVASEFARRHLGFELEWQKGLPGRGTGKRIQSFWKEIGTHLEDGPVIVVFCGPEKGESHWTCIVQSKEKVVRLKDSTGLKMLRKRGGTLGEDVRNKRLFFWKTVFLLSPKQIHQGRSESQPSPRPR